jgi:hypothetical protein
VGTLPPQSYSWLRLSGGREEGVGMGVEVGVAVKVGIVLSLVGCVRL